MARNPIVFIGRVRRDEARVDEHCRKCRIQLLKALQGLLPADLAALIITLGANSKMPQGQAHDVMSGSLIEWAEKSRGGLPALVQSALDLELNVGNGKRPSSFGAFDPLESDRNELVRYLRDAGVDLLPDCSDDCDLDGLEQHIRNLSPRPDLFVLLTEPESNGMDQNDDLIQLRLFIESGIHTIVFNPEGRRRIPPSYFESRLLEEHSREGLAHFRHRICTRARELVGDVVTTARLLEDTRIPPVLVKVHDADRRGVAPLLQLLSQAAGYDARRNGVHAAALLRDRPFSAIIVVLGECDTTWEDDRQGEFVTLEIEYKPKPPIRIWYRRKCCPPDRLAPIVHRDIVTIDEGNEAQLLELISKRWGQ